MEVRIKLTREEKVVYQGVHAATDAQTFGRAFANIWDALHARRLEQATSVGELMSRIADDVLDDLDGATISIERLDC